MQLNVTEPHFVEIGPHRAALEPPDLVRITCDGHLLPEHMRALQELVAAQMLSEKFFVIVDLTRLLGMPSATRKVATSTPIASRIAGAAYIGASFQMRVLTTMMGKAIALIHPSKRTETAFFEDEREALRWIESLRHTREARP